MDININEIKTLPTPQELIDKYSIDSTDTLFIENSRSEINNILLNKTDKLLVVIGPCSIHSLELALDYANNIKIFQENNPNLFIIMRVYFEKPRSRHGWKGFIYDPDLDESYNITKGLNLARELLVKLTKLRIPIGCEFLDSISPQYLADLVSWGAIGARTSESQVHRQLASGLSMPIGFKNLTDGDYKKAIDGMLSARYPHHFLGIDYNGKACHVSTKGNSMSHLILRGGLEPNYYQKDIEEITNELIKENISTGIIIDCSHGNSQKEYLKQILVSSSINKLLLLNKYKINGVMIESNIFEGNQKLTKNLKYGISITDACIDIDASHYVLSMLNSYKTIKQINNLYDIRKYLSLFEDSIMSIINNEFIEDSNILNTLLIENIISPDIVINYDNELFEICNSSNNKKINPLLLLLLHKRLGTSELIANIKYDINIYNFLIKSNDYYKLVTDRDIEKIILYRINRENNSPVNSPIISNKNTELFIRIMELSKRIQVKYLEEYIKNKKIGYLGTKATFSYEVISKNFSGKHISINNLNNLYDSLNNKTIDYALIPTYNSLIGIVFEIDSKYTILGSIDHKIELSLYANNNLKDINNCHKLYVQEIVYKEACEYINKKLKNITIVLCETTEDGCIKCIQDTNSMTIASKYNNCNFLQLIEDNIIDHNITTFNLIKI
jgi:3-deoxy-7-phosphoheptulonate synthase